MRDLRIAALSVRWFLIQIPQSEPDDAGCEKFTFFLIHPHIPLPVTYCSCWIKLAIRANEAKDIGVQGISLMEGGGCCIFMIFSEFFLQKRSKKR